MWIAVKYKNFIIRTNLHIKRKYKPFQLHKIIDLNLNYDSSLEKSSKLPPNPACVASYNKLFSFELINHKQTYKR